MTKPSDWEAIDRLISMCLVHGDFSNGVTDPTGTIDEGDVKAWEIISDAKVAFEKVAQKHSEWHPVTEMPASGSKLVALYSDGSGAPLLWRHDGGYVDQDGANFDESWFLGHVLWWAYVPEGFRFWCEDCEDPLTLR